MKKHIDVVGAVIVRDGLILCAQRGLAGKLPGMWEFPGGKVEEGETSEGALVREISEELGCTIKVNELINTASHEYDFGIVELTTFYCELVSGVPSLSEHQAILWLRPDELATVEWAPADLPAVAEIQSPTRNS